MPDQVPLPHDTIALARFLLGKLLIRALPDGDAVARIVETEAYPPGDAAAHHYRRMTERNRSLFAALGTAYVYRAYGVCWLLNVASETAGIGAGVLIRAAEPVALLHAMQARRPGASLRDLARGPGRLAQAMDIDRSLDGIDLRSDERLRLADDAAAPPKIGASVRIGITRAVDAPWRFYVRGSRFVSGPASLNL